MRRDTLLLVCVLHALVAAPGEAGCPFPGFAAHRLAVRATLPHSLLNATVPALNASKYGLEGGAAVVVGGSVYVATAEFTGDPLFVPSRLALYRAPLPTGAATTGSSATGSSGGAAPWQPPLVWTRVETLWTSGGKVTCTDPRASLGSSITPVFNAAADAWELFYVGFYSCNSSHFVNQRGRIFRARSTAGGREGIEGPYRDLGVAISPDGAQGWEGLQGTDSLAPYQLGDGTWASFYGSANTQDPQSEVVQQVGLAFAKTLDGPWVRAPGNPVNLSSLDAHIEQPIVTRLPDGSFCAVFDSLQLEYHGQVGYAWSPDGRVWHPECALQLHVFPDPHTAWAASARTPQGLVPSNIPGAYNLFFSGMAKAGDRHRFEVLGVALTVFDDPGGE